MNHLFVMYDTRMTKQNTVSLHVTLFSCSVQNVHLVSLHYNNLWETLSSIYIPHFSSECNKLSRKKNKNIHIHQFATHESIDFFVVVVVTAQTSNDIMDSGIKQSLFVTIRIN